MSMFMSDRPVAASRGPTSPAIPSLQAIPRSRSKSEQLAKAIAYSQASPHQGPSSFRPDSQWSEGGADVVWNGSYNDHIVPPLPSPATHSTHTIFSDQEFADADEGKMSDGEASWDGGDTTMTTLSTSDSRRNANASQPHSPLYSTPIFKLNPPTRPQRKTSPRPEQSILPGPPSDDEEDTADPSNKSTYGHNRTSSVGSSIWAGRGVKDDQSAIPPVPERKFPSSHQIGAFADAAKGRQSIASSVYSDRSPALDMDDSPTFGSIEQFSSDKNVDPNSNRRRLVDGTIVPKMPPIPSSNDKNAEGNQMKSRSRRGRQNRSPILSYADGAEEEERLVEEREFREHGGIHNQAVTSSMGPRLKKNSPAPWEMSEADEAEGASRPSGESWGMSSRPSGEQIPSSFSGKVGNLRSRNPSNGSQLSSLSLVKNVPSKEPLVSPTGSSQDVSTLENAAIGRRSRSKSMSNSAAGVLKGLGLASSAAPASKKSSKIGKAFRGMSASTSRSSSSSLGVEGRKSQGISSEDFAHLPPSPLPDHRFDTNPLDSENGSKMTQSLSKGNTLISDTHTLSSRKAGPPSTMERQSSSNDSFAGTSTNSSSHYTALTSPGSQVERKPDLADLLMASTGKYRDQSYISPPKKGPAKGNSSSALAAGSNGRTLPSSNSSSNVTQSSHQAVNSTPSKLMAERSQSVTPTKIRNDGDSSPSVRAASGREQILSSSSTALNEVALQAMTRAGPLENTPYKLISLEQARSLQKPTQPRKASLSNKEVSRMDRSTSNKSLDQMSDSKGEAPIRTLKNKKSGFLRMFGKDKVENNEEIESTPSMPDNVNSFQQRQDRADHYEGSDELSSLRRPKNLNNSLQAPALSVRPMSSMFNGLSPTLIDSSSVANDKKDQDVSTSYTNNGLLAPQSPAITVYSYDGNTSSRASSQVFYEDAMDVPPFGQDQQQHLYTTSNPSSSRRTERKKPKALQLHRSSDSMHSEVSSCNLINGFPPTPITSPMTGHDGSFHTFQENNNTNHLLGSITRNKAVEIESKIADLLNELVKLRTSAVEANGSLASPSLSTQSDAATEGNNHSLSSPALKMVQGNTSNISLHSSSNQSILPPSPSALSHTITPCSTCGCNCADSKRVQALNEMALIKGMSVLDRGRALKPLTDASAGKFGGYVHR